MRDVSLRHRRRVQCSSDGGLTLERPAVFDEELLDPPCHAAIIGVRDGGVFFSNPSHPYARRNLTLRYRPWADEATGEEHTVGGWRAALTLEEGYASYSALTWLSSRRAVGCLYEARENARAIIKFVAIPLSAASGRGYALHSHC